MAIGKKLLKALFQSEEEDPFGSDDELNEGEEKKEGNEQDKDENFLKNRKILDFESKFLKQYLLP